MKYLRILLSSTVIVAALNCTNGTNIKKVSDASFQLNLHAPIDKWDEAIPLGNGLTSGLLWGSGNFSTKEYVGKLAPFPETPEGQKEFLDEVTRIVLAVPDNRGCGIFWWEPAAPGNGFSTRTFIDKEGNSMPVINVFDKYTRK